MAMNGAKAANPGMQPPEAFLRDLDIMVRTLVTGAVATSPRQQPAKAPAKKSVRSKPPSKTPGGRR
jgi:hypothetical protein